MLDTLRTVHGAVAEKDLVPALTHFHIYDGRIQGCNSRMAIDAPLPELAGLNITVPADRFIKAIDLCDDEPTLTIGDGHVIVRQGRFHVRLPILANDSFPRSEPNPPDWEPDDGSTLLDVLRTLSPFVSTNALNVWSTGIWMEEGWAYATNNVILLRARCDFLTGTDHRINLPEHMVAEVLRIGLEPVQFGVSDNSLTIYYESGAWIKSNLIAAEWPVEKLRALYADKKFKAPKFNVVPALLDAVEKVAPFCGDAKFPVIKFHGGIVETEGNEYSAAVDGFDLPEVRFNANMLRLVLAHATSYQPSDKHNLFCVGDAQGIFMPLLA